MLDSPDKLPHLDEKIERLYSLLRKKLSKHGTTGGLEVEVVEYPELELKKYRLRANTGTSILYASYDNQLLALAQLIVNHLDPRLIWPDDIQESLGEKTVTIQSVHALCQQLECSPMRVSLQVALRDLCEDYLGDRKSSRPDEDKASGSTAENLLQLCWISCPYARADIRFSLVVSDMTPRAPIDQEAGAFP